MTSLAAHRRKEARQWEWAEQIVLAEQLTEMLDPDCTFWTAVDNTPWSKVHGILRKRRGCRSGTPDILVLYKRRLIFLELKSLGGRLSKAQKAVRLEILAGGGRWYLVRSARAALVALHRAGVRFRVPWTPPKLEAWERPVADPTERMVWHPGVLRQWREDKGRWRARRESRAREIRQEAA